MSWEKKIFSMISLVILLTIAVPPNAVEKTFAQEFPVPREEALVWVWDGTFTVFDSFNPFGASQWGSGFEQVCNEPLYIWDNYANTTRYWRITGWEYSDNYTTFTLHVRQGVKWNDGEPFTAKDIAFTFQLNIDYGIGKYAALSEVLESIEVVDDYTLVLHLNKPTPRLHTMFYGEEQFILPEHIWKDKDPLTFKNNPPVDTGPYKLLVALPDAGMFVWERDENYWAKEVMGVSPGPKYIVFRTQTPVDIALADFAAGLVDISHPIAFAGLEIVQAAHRAHEQSKLIMLAGDVTNGFWFNCQKYPFNMPEFRRAISYCVNREKMTIFLSPKGDVADFPWLNRPDLERFRYPDILEKYGIKYDPDEAVRILDDLGFIDRNGDGVRETPNGTKLSFGILTGPWEPYIPMAIDLAEELKKIGIDAFVDQVDSSVWYDRRNRGAFCMAANYLAGGGVVGDIFPFLNEWHSSNIRPPGDAYVSEGWKVRGTRYSNPELDEVLDQLALLSPDDPEAEPLYKKAVEIIMRDLPVIPAIEGGKYLIVSTQYWTGWPNFMDSGPWNRGNELVLHLKPVAPIEYKLVWFTKDVEAFTGVDGETYGPYTTGEYDKIPLSDAERLVKEGSASYSSPTETELESRITTLEAAVETLTEQVETLAGQVEALSGQGTMSTVGIGLSIVAIIIAVVAIVTKRK